MYIVIEKALKIWYKNWNFIGTKQVSYPCACRRVRLRRELRRKWIEVFLVDRVEQPKTCGLRHPKTQKYSPAEQGLGIWPERETLRGGRRIGEWEKRWGLTGGLHVHLRLCYT
jgi:hypothetical protein